MYVRLLGENTDNAVALFVLLKNRLILYKIEVSGHLLCVRLSPDTVVYRLSNCCKCVLY